MRSNVVIVDGIWLREKCERRIEVLGVDLRPELFQCVSYEHVLRRV